MASVDRPFISALEASRIIGIDHHTFRRRFAARFTSLALPGMQPRYSRAEVVAFRDQNTKPAPALAEVVS